MRKRAKKASASVSIRPSLQSLWMSVPFYVWFILITWKPLLIGLSVGASERSLGILVLKGLAVLSIAGFFSGALKTVEHPRWQLMTVLNAILASAPVYFLWITFSP